MHRLVFISGIILTIVSSTVVGVLNVGILFFAGIPLLPLFVGIVMIWLSKAPLIWRVGGTVLAIPIMAAAFLINVQLGKAEKELFLLPEDFRGEFVILYDEPCGSEPKFEDGRRVYEIPQSGVLVTKFLKNKGFLDRKFFFVAVDSGRREFPEFHSQNYETEREEWNYFHSTPVEEFTNETVGAFWSYGSTLVMVSKNLFGYVVADYDNWKRTEKDRSRERNEFENNATRILKDCRLNAQKTN